MSIYRPDTLKAFVDKQVVGSGYGMGNEGASLSMPGMTDSLKKGLEKNYKDNLY